MGEESVLLIDDLFLPEGEIHEHVTAIDLTMMSALAAIERTWEQWRKLIDSVGCEILSSYYYKPASCEGVIAVGRKSSAA